MRHYLFVLLVFVCLFSGLRVIAGQPAVSLMHGIALSLTSVTGGLPTEDKKDAHGRPIIESHISGNVELIFWTSDTTYETCTGRIVEGCIIAAKHCRDKVKNASVFVGFSPVISAMPASYTLEGIDIGEPGDLSTDITVLKMYRPPGAIISTPRDKLARERAVIDPKNPKSGVIIGYGQSTTIFSQQVAADGVTKQWVSQDAGMGFRQRGTVAVQGYGALKDTKASRGQGVSTTGNILWLGRGPSLPAYGDSGLLVDIDGLLHGIMSKATGRSVEAEPDRNEPVRQDKPFVNELTGAKFASIPDNYEAIEKAMNDLHCKENMYENVMNDLGKQLAAVNAFTKVDDNGKTKKFKWSAMDDEAKKHFEAMVARIVNVLPGEPLSLSDPRVTQDGVAFTVSSNFKGHRSHQS